MTLNDKSVLSITPVIDSRTKRDFIQVPGYIYKDDCNWVAPLYLERRIHLSKLNPYFKHAHWQAWVAYLDNQAVGRISAQIDQLYLDRYPDKTGFFGFFDVIDNAHIADKLLQIAEQWLKEQGMHTVRGPFSLSINDECGLLINGFDTPPSYMMSHTRPYQQNFIENNAYKPVKDLLVYQISRDFPVPRNMQVLIEKAQESIKIRPLRRHEVQSDLSILRDIFNDAWSENWGFIPFTESEFEDMGKQLLHVVDDDFVQIAEMDGQHIGMIIMLPNLNEIIADLNGRLLPFGWLKFLWRLKKRSLRSARVPLMGIRKQYQDNIIAGAASCMLIDALREPASRWGIETVELSWILEDNTRMRTILENINSQIYKTYRIYGKQPVSNTE